MKESDKNFIIYFLGTCLLMSILICEKFYLKNSKLTKTIKKINKELNKIKELYTDLQNLHKAGLIMNIFPTSAANHLLKFCSFENVNCPITSENFRNLKYLEKVFEEKKFDKIINFANHYNINDKTIELNELILILDNMEHIKDF